MNSCLALVLLAMMVQSEAGSEPFDGKIAVAYVAVNRAAMTVGGGGDALTKALDLEDALLKVLRQPKQFALNPRVAISESSWLAARIALERLQPDPTRGADHFYNPLVHPWPEWYDERYITMRIGRHAFLKLGGF